MSAAKPDVPQLIQELRDEVAKLNAAMENAMREVSWAYQDALDWDGSRSGILLPREGRDAAVAEYAVRAVLPKHLAALQDGGALVADIAGQLKRLVPPLETTNPPEAAT